MSKTKTKNDHFHDKSYKYLLSNPLIFQELMESFVHMDWVKEVDFKKAKKLSSSFVSEQFKKQESDLIYELKFKRKTIFLYVLIEFQSTVDPFIALRMLKYLLEFYQHLIHNKKLKKLPPVFPILLYNGNKKWTAKQNIFDLIDTPPELAKIKPYLPHFKYFKIIENEFSDKLLEDMSNIISTIFLLEKKDHKHLQEFIKSISDKLKSENINAMQTFLIWLQHYLFKNAAPGTLEKGIKKLKSLTEVKSMLATTIEKWETALRSEGWKKGKSEGWKEGRFEGRSEGIKEEQRIVIENMYAKGFSATFIHDSTGFPQALVKRIIKNLKK